MHVTHTHAHPNTPQFYPDIGTAAMLSAQWPDAPFAIGSLSDRFPVKDDDELIVFAAPDPQGAFVRVRACARVCACVCARDDDELIVFAAPDPQGACVRVRVCVCARVCVRACVRGTTMS